MQRSASASWVWVLDRPTERDVALVFRRSWDNGISVGVSTWPRLHVTCISIHFLSCGGDALKRNLTWLRHISLWTFHVLYIFSHWSIGRFYRGVMPAFLLGRSVIILCISCLMCARINAFYWHCSHSMRQRLCNGVTVRCPSVCLSVCRPLQAAAAGLLLWTRRAGYRSIALATRRRSRTAHSSTPFSSKCEQCHVVS